MRFPVSILFGLSALEAIAALVVLAALPADAENAFLLGFSTRRLVVMAVLAAAAAGSAALAFLSAGRLQSGRIASLAQRQGFRAAAFLLLAGLALLSGLVPAALLSMYRTSGEFRYFAYYERLLPLFAWMGLSALQFALYLGLRGGLDWRALRERRDVWRAALAVLGAFLLAWLFVWITGIGRTPDQIGWGAPSVPLLEWQIGLAWAAAVGLLFWLAVRRAPARLDAWIATALWLLAAGLWLSQPIHTAFFATAGRPPNNEIYPFSDGSYYGVFAQNLLIGNGFQGSEVPPRPHYIALLALFHAIAGQDYARVIAVQTLLLAFLPVTLYFLGKELHSRPAGLAAALLAILRELTAIFTVHITDKASNSQLFFGDLPSALAIAVWALASVRWIKSFAPGRAAPGRAGAGPGDPLRALLAGGTMGLAMLFRTQSIFMLPGMLLLALLAVRRPRLWLAQSVLVAVGLVVVITPWLARNYRITGSFAFDDPKSQAGVMAQRYNVEDEQRKAEFIARPGEDIQEFSDRVYEGIFSYMLANPGRVARFFTAHLLNNETGNLLMLPTRDGLDGPRELLMPTRAFWQSWDGAPSAAQALLMLLHLGLLALGTGGMWARGRWVGLALLAMNLSYNASNSLARNSGWRYLLPVDWTVIVTAAVGLVELAIAAGLVFGRRLDASALDASKVGGPAAAPSRPILLRVAALCALMALVGAFPVLMEHAFPRRYPLQSAEQIAARVAALPALSGQDVAGFAASPGARIIEGRALYPRFYEEGDGEPRTAKAGYEPLPYARTVLQVASNTYNGMVLLPGKPAPGFLPNTADVFVLGCAQKRGYVEARALLVLDPPGAAYVVDGGLAPCAAE